jgi:hypothetical protein
VHLQFLLSEKQKHLNPQSTNTEWRLPISGVDPIMMEKSALAGEGGGCTPTPFITITYKVAVYASAEWADTLPLFHFYTLYMYSVPQSVIIFLDKFVCSIFPKFSNKAQSYNKIYARESVRHKVHTCL